MSEVERGCKEKEIRRERLGEWGERDEE